MASGGGPALCGLLKAVFQGMVGHRLQEETLGRGGSGNLLVGEALPAR